MQLSKRTPRNKSDIAPTLTRPPQKINQVSHSMKNTKKTLKRRTAWAQIDGSMTMSCKLLSLSPLHRRLRFFPFFVCPLFKRNPIPSSRHRPKSDCFSFHSLSLFPLNIKKLWTKRAVGDGSIEYTTTSLLCVRYSNMRTSVPSDSTCIYIPLKFWTDLLQCIEVVASITAKTRANRYTMAASGLKKQVIVFIDPSASL